MQVMARVQCEFIHSQLTGNLQPRRVQKSASTACQAIQRGVTSRNRVGVRKTVVNNFYEDIPQQPEVRERLNAQ